MISCKHPSFSKMTTTIHIEMEELYWSSPVIDQFVTSHGVLTITVMSRSSCLHVSVKKTTKISFLNHMCLSRRFHFVNNLETSLFNVSRWWQEILENICWNLKVLLEDCHICPFPIKKTWDICMFILCAFSI